MSNPYDIFDEEDKQVLRNPYSQFDEKEEKELPSGMYQGQRFLMETLKNAPQSALDYLEGYVNILRDPAGTAEAVGELAQATGNKLGRKGAEIATGQEIAPDPERSELVADVVGEDIKDRYGSGRDLAHTFMTDPVGTLADMSMVGGIVPKLNRITKYGDLATAAGAGVQQVAGKVSRPAYKSAAGIPERMLERGDEIADYGMEQRIPVSRSGLEKIRARQKALGEEIGGIIQQGVDDVKMIPRTVITRRLDDWIEENRYIKSLEDLEKAKKIRASFDTQFGRKQMLDPKELQDWKVNKYDEVYGMEASPEPTIAQGVDAQTGRTMAEGAKDALHLRFPEMVGPDADFSNLQRVKSFIEEAMARADAPDAKIIERFGTRNMLSRFAIGMQKLAEGDLGYVEKHFNTHEIRQMIRLSGELKGTYDEELTR